MAGIPSADGAVQTAFADCTAPVEGKYATAACVSGTAAAAGGVDTAISKCDKPVAGEYVTAICVQGSITEVGSNSAKATCANGMSCAPGSTR